MRGTKSSVGGPSRTQTHNEKRDPLCRRGVGLGEWWSRTRRTTEMSPGREAARTPPVLDHEQNTREPMVATNDPDHALRWTTNDLWSGKLHSLLGPDRPQLSGSDLGESSVNGRNLPLGTR